MNQPLDQPEPLRDPLHNPRYMWNARDYGLAGDGKANDQPALAALVDALGRACEADGHPRVIYCPPGIYRIAGETTVWRSGVTLRGAGGSPIRRAFMTAYTFGPWKGTSPVTIS